jgi:hypothetical protein
MILKEDVRGSTILFAYKHKERKEEKRIWAYHISNLHPYGII